MMIITKFLNAGSRGLKTASAAFLLFSAQSALAQFTAGNIVVLQASDGISALANTGNQVILKEYTPLGAAAFSMGVSTSVNPLIVSGSATSEGQLNLAANGKYLVFGGYAQSLPNATPLAGSASSVISRGVGIVDATGSYTRVATSSVFYNTNNIRSVATDGINNYWSAGANDGTNYFGLNSPAATIQSVTINSRHVAIFNSNLYFATSSGTTGVWQVATGLPLVSGQTTSLIISPVGTGVGSASPYGFYFNPGMTICYLTDDRSIANGGGIQKWVYSAGAWTLAYTLGTGAGSTVGARSVVADFSGANPIVYATTAESSLNRLISITDAGAGSSATTLTTAVTSSIFRGVAFSPYCSNPQISVINNNGPICANQTLSLSATVNASGPGPLTYTWSGPANFTASVQSPTLTGATSGNYTLGVNNNCGMTSLSASITINPLPVISVNSATICTGGNVVLAASGGTAYSWSTGSNSSSITVSPATNTTYVVNVISAQGCSASATSSITLTNAPSISVNSTTVCAGTTATLTASGVSNYTWSAGPSTPVLTITPSSTTVYTVIGMASGCGAVVSNTAMVSVNSLPLVSVNSATICAGKTATLTASGALTYSWSTGALLTSVVNVTPSATTFYTVTGVNITGCFASTVAVVSVNPLPAVSLAAINSPVCTGSPSLALTGTPAGGSYSGTGVSGSFFTPSTVGTFTVVYTYTNSNNCSNTDSKTINVSQCTGINEISKDASVSVYPNPASEQIQVNVENLSGDCTITLYSLDGRQLASQVSSTRTTLMTISTYPAGVYFIKINTGRSGAYVKFIKE